MLPARKTCLFVACLLLIRLVAFGSHSPGKEEVLEVRHTSIALELFNILDAPEKSKTSNETVVNKTPAVDRKVYVQDSVTITKLLKKADPIVHKDYQKAFKLTSEALELAQTTNNSELMGKTQNSMGHLYWYTGDYTHASEYYFNALKNFQKTKNQVEIASCYRNIGWIYMGQGKYDLCEKYLLKSLKLHEQLNDFKKVIINYDDLGNLYITSKQYEKGLTVCEQSIKLALKHQFTEGLGAIHATKGILLYHLKRYSESEQEFKTAIRKMSDQSEHNYNLCLANLGMGKLKNDLKAFQEALSYVEQAIALGVANNFAPELAEAYRLASGIHKKLKNLPKALDYMELYAVTNDTVNRLNNRSYIRDLAAHSEFEQNELQIKNLKQEGELAAAHLARERNFKLILIVALLAILVVAVQYYRSYSMKKKANLLLEKAYNEIENKSKDLSDSIEYAYKIQDTRLPQISVLEENFSDFFVFYQPRDIVSGDFYWFHDASSNGKILAVADCTGHGIAGAFMSMIGIDALNSAVLEKELYAPNTILKQVNTFLNDSIKNKQDSMSRRMCMDMGVCVFAPDFSELTFAGANRPLWIVRNQELLVYGPDRMFVGGDSDPSFQFTSHHVKLQKGDCIYLFSDGFQDQFGGPEEKKFLTKNLKQLFLTNADLPSEQQHALIHTTFQEWKGNCLQVDDVTVIGIKV